MNRFSENQIISLFSERPVESLDDCSDIPGTDLIVSTDSLCENTHFRLDWSQPEDIAVKTVHVNISDVAVSGGIPQWALLNIGIPENITEDFLKRFSAALRRELSAENVSLIGGDTYRSRELNITLTAGGPVLNRMHRSGGNPGDILYVTGHLGLSLLGFRILSGKTDIKDESLRDQAVRRHLSPRSRREWALKLAESGQVHAAMDITDGLTEDASRLAAASGISLIIDTESVPSQKGAAPFALNSGEELEILFLASPDFHCPVPATAIGRAAEYKEGTKRIHFTGSEADPENSFYHFKKNTY